MQDYLAKVALLENDICDVIRYYVTQMEYSDHVLYFWTWAPKKGGLVRVMWDNTQSQAQDSNWVRRGLEWFNDHNVIRNKWRRCSNQQLALAFPMWQNTYLGTNFGDGIWWPRDVANGSRGGPQNDSRVSRPKCLDDHVQGHKLDSYPSCSLSSHPLPKVCGHPFYIGFLH